MIDMIKRGGEVKLAPRRRGKRGGEVKLEPRRRGCAALAFFRVRLFSLFFFASDFFCYDENHSILY
jgi:hypothetical protein